MTTFALDLGTLTGWAIKTPAGVSSGVEKFAKRARDTDGDRLLRFSGWLTSMKGAGLELVVYEKAVGRYKSMGAQTLFPQFEGVLLLWCARHQIRVRPVNQSTLKKLATGNGHAEKEDVARAVRDLGYRPADTNEADALALLLTATGDLVVEPPPKPKRKRTAAPQQAPPPLALEFDKPF